MNLTEYCTGIADAIREVEGSTEKIPAPDHAARIKALSGGGGVSTCTITITGYATSGVSENVGYALTRCVDGEMVLDYSVKMTAASVTITDVVCGTMIYAHGGDTIGVRNDWGASSINGLDLPARLRGNGMASVSAIVQAPLTAGSTGTITISED